MDGYSFMMFAVGSSILATYLFFRIKEKRAYFLKFAFPLHFLAFGLAVLLYILYIITFMQVDFMFWMDIFVLGLQVLNATASCEVFLLMEW